MSQTAALSQTATATIARDGELTGTDGLSRGPHGSPPWSP
jgi:hypothetical protein